MVLQKRLYYGFNGYQVPPMPRGSRSARGKRSFRKKDKENPMCAFEMLAMVAGKLLLEKETPKLSSAVPGCLPKSTIKQESGEEKRLKLEPCDQGSCDESSLASEGCHDRIFQKLKLKGCLQDYDSGIQQAGITIKSEIPMKIHNELKYPLFKSSKDEIRDSFIAFSENCCAQTYSPGTAESHVTNVTKVEVRTSASLQTGGQNATNDVDKTFVNLFCMEDPMILDPKLPTLDSSDSSVEAPPTGMYISSNQIFLDNDGHVDLVDRDDDENSSMRPVPSSIFSKAFRSQYTEDKRIRKMLASKFWKVGPTLLRDGESSNNADAHVKPIFRSRRMCHTRQRSQRSSFRRRKLLEHGPVTSNGGLGNPASFELADKDSKKEASFVATALYGGQKPQFKSEDYQVKFSIKSLKVPEILIEMPETATVSALKQAVLETVTAIIHDGFRVGVIFQGKKIKDDNKTLIQTGLSNGAKLDSLGFCLEPIPSQARPRLTECEGLHFLQQCDSIESLSRLPAADSGVPSSPYDLTKRCTECPANYTRYADKPVTELSATFTALPDDDNSKAMVPFPAMTVEDLAVVPFQRKSRRSELVQRRIRRPFSVTEVEALVQAVEVLGTGRWRDVKLRAFEDAKHRTYVDLKDKWKTLVHTARISPQQRRGEPVPQELLDRVLNAHAYWSHQQAKLQVKQQPETLLL